MAHPLDDWASEALARYGGIVAGLGLGIAGRYGLTVDEGRHLTRRMFLSDGLLLGAFGVIALAIGDWCGLSGNARVVDGFLTALAGARVVRLARTAFVKRFSAEIEQLADVSHAGDVIRVPAGSGVPDEIGTHSGTADAPIARAGAALQGAFRSPTITRPPGDQIELLRKLDQPRP